MDKDNPTRRPTKHQSCSARTIHRTSFILWPLGCVFVFYRPSLFRFFFFFFFWWVSACVRQFQSNQRVWTEWQHIYSHKHAHTLHIEYRDRCIVVTNLSNTAHICNQKPNTTHHKLEFYFLLSCDAVWYCVYLNFRLFLCVCMRKRCRRKILLAFNCPG